MSDKQEETTQSESTFVSDQLAVKVWSVIARFHHEGDGIVLLRKAWDRNNEEFVVFPTYKDQSPEAMQPDVWMTWRHELKPPMAGHSRIRDYAEVIDAIAVHSAGALAAVDDEFALNQVEVERRFGIGEPGLVALVLRVYHLPRSYRFANVAENEGDGEFVPLPFNVDLDGLEPVLDDAAFERRLDRVRAALKP